MTSPDWRRFLKFRCTGCGNCCRNTIVCFTDADVRRITERTGKPRLDFVRFYSHDDIAMSDDDPLWVRLGKKKHVMGLKTAQDRCEFLENSTNRCTLYEHRPVTSRNQPLNVTFSGTGAVEMFSLSHIVKCTHERDGTIQRRELRRIHCWNERQQEAYLKKIRQWNRLKLEVKTAPGFLRVLGFEA